VTAGAFARPGCRLLRAGSWLGLDGSRSLSLMAEAQHAAADFLLAGGARFAEARCAAERWLPGGAASGASGAAGAGPGAANATGQDWPVCWELVQPAAREGRCTVLSVVQPGGSGNSSEGGGGGCCLAPQDLGFELALAAEGCRVQLVTPLQLAAAPGGGAPSLPAQVSVHREALDAVDDPLGPLPRYSLPRLLERHAPGVARGGGSRAPGPAASSRQAPAPAPAELLVVKISCGSCAWAALNQLHLRGSAALQRVGLLLLEVAPPPAGALHQAYAAYQHLYQEVGLLGYSHRSLPGGGARLALVRHTWQPGE
jgi:hypothetical protein